MSKTIWVRKLYNTIVPLDQDSADALESLKPNGEYKAELTQPRNGPYHRKFFSFLNTCYKNYEQPEVYYDGQRVFKSIDRFREEIIIGCGYWDLGLNKRNQVIRVAKSISFSKMEQIEFEALFSEAINVVLRDYLPNYTRSDIDKLALEILRYG